MKIIETERLILRKINQDDYKEMKTILQDEKLMLVGWGKTFSDSEVRVWIDRITKQYKDFGYSYYLAIEKSTTKVIGIMGILPINIKETDYTEIAYILKQEFWGKGYAIEGINACTDYIFNVIKKDEFIAQIIPENTSSTKVVERLGMTVIDDYIRHHNGKDVFHLIYSLTKEDYLKRNNLTR